MPEEYPTSPSLLTSAPRPREVKTSITVSWGALGKIATAILLAMIAWKLWPLCELLLLGLLIALTLWPIVRGTVALGGPRWLGVLLAALLVGGFVLFFVGILIPALASQVTAVIQNLPAFKTNLISNVTGDGLRGVATRLMDSPAFTDPKPLMDSFVAWGKMALQGIAKFLVVLVVAVYFTADGERVYGWLSAFLPRRQRRKVAEAAPEITKVVSSYMTGQLITSLIRASFVFGMLWWLKVPNGLLLAVMAGIFDILPIIGFFLAVLPAMAVALTVAPGTAFLVLALYLAYHLIENYFIVPKVYGNRLRLSTLTVLVSCLAGALLTGVTGAIAILPIVASYPIIERIWLRPLLEPDTVEKHQAIDDLEHGEEKPAIT